MNKAADPPPSRAGSLPLVGGVLALDFCNTSSGRGTEGHLDHLKSCDDLLEWAGHAGIIEPAAKTGLRHRYGKDARAAAGLIARAIGFREALHRLVADLAARRPPREADIDAIAKEHAACVASGRLTMHDGGFGWTWTVERAGGDAVLGPVAASAMALITEADRARLKQCSGHHCGWLFLDTTKSNNRRWCEMEVCGNRAKQKRRRIREAE